MNIPWVQENFHRALSALESLKSKLPGGAKSREKFEQELNELETVIKELHSELSRARRQK